MFGHIREFGLGVLGQFLCFLRRTFGPFIPSGKAKRLWTRPALSSTTPEVTVSESFDTPHIFITEESKTPFNPIRRRARVQVYQDAHLDVHYTIQNLHDADHESEHEYEYEYEAGLSESVWSEDSSHLERGNDYQYQDSTPSWRKVSTRGSSETPSAARYWR